MHSITMDYTNLHKELLKDINYDNSSMSTVVIDLVTLMGATYSEDVTIKKNNNTPRNINFTLPVFNVELWVENKHLIEELLKWVSGDNFTISIVPNFLITDDFINNLLPPNHHPVSLFSGGLDSLSGAYYNYNNGKLSDYIGFINKNEEKTHQVTVSQFYSRVFDSSTEILLIDKPVKRKITLIQSTRSLLYFALAVAKAFFNNSDEVYLFENGILSLNPELNNRYTTKTTHPKTLFLYNNILKSIGLKTKVYHPFIFKTKGQIINTMNERFKEIISDTFTCGSGRSHLKAHTGQCGICIPCLLRKISLAAYDNEKYDSEYHYGYNIKVNEIQHDTYRKEYASNLDYFRRYYESIVNKGTHLVIHTKEKYYNTINYRVSNQEMFQIFAHEYERFMTRYGIY